ALITIIISIWLICAHTCAPRAYNYWANLFFDLYLYIFWLTTFSLAAVWAGLIFAAGHIGGSSSSGSYKYAFCEDYFDHYTDVSYYNKYCLGSSGSSSSSSRSNIRYLHNVNAKVFGGVVAAIAGLGAIEFLLFFISWVTDAVVIYRHRRDGGHNRPGRRAAAAGSVAAPYQVPVQMQPQVKTDTGYHAVPQQGIPFAQQDTAYNPHQMYSAPQGYAPQGYPQQQQSLYPQAQQQPIAPQHTGNSYVQTHTPPAGGYPAPQYPPQPAAMPYQQQHNY
ncbi:hypothetical protein QQS21_012192, partial [Conoideocrella luteorostrata]